MSEDRRYPTSRPSAGQEGDEGATRAAPAGVPPGCESYSPRERNYAAGGDLLGTDRSLVVREAVDSDDPADPGILLDEGKDLLVINDPGSLRRLLARKGSPAKPGARKPSASGEIWTSELDEADSAKKELDSDVLARAADWIEW